MAVILEHNGLKWIENWSKKMVDELHLRLEAPGTDFDTTNLIRGQIQGVRRCVEDANRAHATGEMI